MLRRLIQSRGRNSALPLGNTSTSTTSRLHRLLIGVVAMLALYIAPQPARAADAVDIILDVLVTGGVVDPVFKEAKTAVQCLAAKGGINPQSLQECAEESANAQAMAVVNGNPKLKTVIDVVLAVSKKQWVTVLELVGTDGTRVIVCGVLPGGAVKDLFCGEIFKIAKPVIKPALKAVLSGDWAGLITMLGPKIACEIIPGGTVRDALCGPLAALAEGIKDTVEYAVKPIKAGVDFVIEAVENQDDPMSLEKFYQYSWLPYSECATWLNIVPKSHQGDFGFKCQNAIEHRYSYCVSYFDNHKMSNSSAKKICDKMNAGFSAQIKAYTSGLKSAPAAYYQSHIQPNLFYYYQKSKLWGNFQAVSNAITSECWPKLFKLYPVPGPDIQSEKPQPNMWNYLCRGVGNQAVSVIEAQKSIFEKQLAQLDALSCKAGFGGKKLPYTCATYSGMLLCRDLLGDAPEKGCVLDQAKADKQLVQTIADELGKRCGVNGNKVVCTRPWKKTECLAKVKQYGDKAGSKPNVACFANLLGFIPLRNGAQKILDTMNEVVGVPVTNVGTGKVTPVPMALNPSCKASWDPLALGCKDSKTIVKLAATHPQIKLPKCQPDPQHDGADQPCYLGPWPVAYVGGSPDQAKADAGILPATEEASAAGPHRGGFVSGGRPPAVGRSGAPVPTPDTARQPYNASGWVPPVVTRGLSSSGATQDRGVPPRSAPPLPGRQPPRAAPGIGAPVASAVTPSSAAPTSGGRGGALSAERADLTALPGLELGTQRLPWGNTARLDAGTGTPLRNGSCQVPVKYTLVNAGTARAAEFGIAWRNRATGDQERRTVAALDGGRRRQEADMLELRSGMNSVELIIDEDRKVDETDESNNRFAVALQLEGRCGAPNLPARPAAGLPSGRAQEESRSR